MAAPDAPPPLATPEERLRSRISAALATQGADPGRRKTKGAVYTPGNLARLVVDQSLAALGRPPVLVLDPACGTGHFLVAAWEALRRDWRGGPPPVSRLRGIEVDEAAAGRTRELLEACAELDRLELGARKARPRVLVGDALTANLSELEGRFDLAIGNPPYVRIDRLDPAYRAALTDRYAPWLAGKWDLYFCFLARTLDFLAPGGILGFVTPNQYFLGRSGRPLRARLASSTVLHQVIDLCGLEPFDQAIPPAAVTVLQKAEPAPGHRVKLGVCLSGGPDGGPRTTGAERRAEVTEPADRANRTERSERFALSDPLALSARIDRTVALGQAITGEVAQARWREGTWSVLAPEPFMQWLDRLDAPRLGDLATNISEGDTRRAEEALLMRASDAPADWWPVVRGRDVGSGCLRIAPRADRLPPGPTGIPESGGRILVRDVAPRLTAAVDPGRTRCLRTVYCVYLADPALTERLTALLNSDLLTWIYIRLYYSSKMSPRAANFRFQTQYLAALPIVLPPAVGSGEALEKAMLEAYGVPAAERTGIRPLLRLLGALGPAARG